MDKILLKDFLPFVGGRTKLIICDSNSNPDEVVEVWRGYVDEINWENIPLGDEYIEHVTVLNDEDWLQIWV